jgi:GDP-mannose 6-dehydrogenase
VRIAVIGLGYVGAVTAVCLARDGHEVIGVDIDRHKLDLLQSGQPPIIEDGLQEVTQQAATSGRLHTQETIDARVAGCDLIFVCVGTPSAANGSQDLTAVKRVAEQLGSVLKSADGFPVIVVRSTVYPGVTDAVLRPLLEESSGKQADRDFGLCFQPEFLREGSSVKDYYQPPFTIVGAASAKPVQALRQLFGAFPAEFIETDIRTAEMLKLVCNAFHALKVSFANEVGRLGRQLGLNARTVMDIVCRDRSLNISPAYLRPGFAYGGSCLPKDLRALLHLGRRNDLEVPLLQGIATCNDLHIAHAATMVRDLGKRHVALLGLSFKPGTDDLRESPLVSLAEQLIGKGYELRIYDPAVSLARLIGANRRYIEHAIPHIGSLLREDLAEVCEYGETIVVGFANPAIRDAVRARSAAGAAIVDLVGLNDATAGKYEGICW